MKLISQGLTGGLALALAASALAQTTTTDDPHPWVGARPFPTDLLSVTHDSLPDTGLTFYSVQRWNQTPPVPTDWTRKLPDSATANLAFYISPSFGTNRIIVDDRLVNYDQAYTELQNQRAVLNAAARLLNLPEEIIPEDLSGGQYMYSLQVPTDGSLWLEITNVTDGLAFLNLDNATNSVYAIWTSTDLLSGWQVEAEVWQTNTSVMPFCLPTLQRTNLFVRAQDWTGLDSDSDGIPDWWIWLYFGNFSQSATNLDTQGNTLLYDYTYGLDPNVISFCLAPFADHVTNTASAFSLNIRAGAPAAIAILVDTNSPGPATWYQFQTNVTVDLGANASEGWHQLWFGVRGRLTTSIQTWQSARVKVDRTPPQLLITNTIPATTDQSYVQVQGYANEQLSQLVCTVANTNGVTTNDTAAIVRRDYSVPTAEFTTNWFQCFDVLLASGTNTITVRATDLAGNNTATNLLVTLDPMSNTNAPALVISWPPSGATIGSADLNCFGTLDNPSASVYAVLTDSSGQATPAIAEVERDGHFWIDHLPLSAGTNSLTLTATSPAGITTIAALTLVRSAANITVDAPFADWLNTPPVPQLTGTVPSAGYIVTVNGMETYLLDTQWFAQYLPLDPSSSTAVFLVRAVPQSGPTIEYAYVAIKPPRFYISEFWYSNRIDTVQTTAPMQYDSIPLESNADSQTAGGRAGRQTRSLASGAAYNDSLEYATTSIEAGHWADHQPGTSITRQIWNDGSWSGTDGSWPAAWWPTMAGGTNICWLNSGTYSFTNEMHPSVTNEQWNAEYTVTSPDGTLTSHYLSQAAAFGAFYAGGVRYIAGLNVLAVATASALDYGSDGLSQPVTTLPEQIQISTFGRLSTNATLPVLLAAGSTVDFTATVPSRQNTVAVQPAPPTPKPQIWFRNKDVTGKKTVVWVGENMSLTFRFDVTPADPVTNYIWRVPGPAFSDIAYSSAIGLAPNLTNSDLTNASVTYYWTTAATQAEVSCSAVLRGLTNTAKTLFEVRKPEVAWTLAPKYPVGVSTNYAASAGPWLSCGLGHDTNDCGVLFNFQVTDLKGYTNAIYHLICLQVRSLSAWENFSSDTNLHRCVATNGLDEAYPYFDWQMFPPGLFPGAPTSGSISDSPGQPLSGKYYATIADSFESYLLFKPEGGKPVPLKHAGWSWSGAAAATNPPPAYALTASVNPVSASGSPWSTPPTWTNLIAATNFSTFWRTNDCPNP
jgi:hypothetical protein